MNKYPFQGINKRFRLLRSQLPTILGEVALRDFQENFRRQGYRDASGGIILWDERQLVHGDDPNRGVLIGKGSGYMNKAFKNSPTNSMARVVNYAKYAAVHNQGLPLKGKKRVLNGFTKSGRPRYKRTAEAAKMTKRPFMITTAPLLNDIEKEAFQEIDKLFNSL